MRLLLALNLITSAVRLLTAAATVTPIGKGYTQSDMQQAGFTISGRSAGVVLADGISSKKNKLQITLKPGTSIELFAPAQSGKQSFLGSIASPSKTKQTTEDSLRIHGNERVGHQANVTDESEVVNKETNRESNEYKGGATKQVLEDKYSQQKGGQVSKEAQEGVKAEDTHRGTHASVSKLKVNKNITSLESSGKSEGGPNTGDADKQVIKTAVKTQASKKEGSEVAKHAGDAHLIHATAKGELPGTSRDELKSQERKGQQPFGEGTTVGLHVSETPKTLKEAGKGGGPQTHSLDNEHLKDSDLMNGEEKVKVHENSEVVTKIPRENRKGKKTSTSKETGVKAHGTEQSSVLKESTMGESLEDGKEKSERHENSKTNKEPQSIEGNKSKEIVREQTTEKNRVIWTGSTTISSILDEKGKSTKVQTNEKIKHVKEGGKNTGVGDQRGGKVTVDFQKSGGAGSGSPRGNEKGGSRRGTESDVNIYAFKNTDQPIKGSTNTGVANIGAGEAESSHRLNEADKRSRRGKIGGAPNDRVKSLDSTQASQNIDRLSKGGSVKDDGETKVELQKIGGAGSGSQDENEEAKTKGVNKTAVNIHASKKADHPGKEGTNAGVNILDEDDNAGRPNNGDIGAHLERLEERPHGEVKSVVQTQTSKKVGSVSKAGGHKGGETLGDEGEELKVSEAGTSGSRNGAAKVIKSIVKLGAVRKPDHAVKESMIAEVGHIGDLGADKIEKLVDRPHGGVTSAVQTQTSEKIDGLSKGGYHKERGTIGDGAEETTQANGGAGSRSQERGSKIIKSKVNIETIRKPSRISKGGIQVGTAQMGDLDNNKGEDGILSNYRPVLATNEGVKTESAQFHNEPSKDMLNGEALSILKGGSKETTEALGEKSNGGFQKTVNRGRLRLLNGGAKATGGALGNVKSDISSQGMLNVGGSRLLKEGLKAFGSDLGVEGGDGKQGTLNGGLARLKGGAIASGGALGDVNRSGGSHSMINVGDSGLLKDGLKAINGAIEVGGGGAQSTLNGEKRLLQGGVTASGGPNGKLKVGGSGLLKEGLIAFGSDLGVERGDGIQGTLNGGLTRLKGGAKASGGALGDVKRSGGSHSMLNVGESGSLKDGLKDISGALEVEGEGGAQSTLTGDKRFLKGGAKGMLNVGGSGVLKSIGSALGMKGGGGLRDTLNVGRLPLLQGGLNGGMETSGSSSGGRESEGSSQGVISAGGGRKTKEFEKNMHKLNEEGTGLGFEAVGRGREEKTKYGKRGFAHHSGIIGGGQDRAQAQESSSVLQGGGNAEEMSMGNSRQVEEGREAKKGFPGGSKEMEYHGDINMGGSEKEGLGILGPKKLHLHVHVHPKFRAGGGLNQGKPKDSEPQKRALDEADEDAPSV